MSFEERRKYIRTPYTKHMRYFAPVLTTQGFMKIYGDGVIVDLSEGGLGMITPFLLKEGDIVFFEHDIRIKDHIVAKASTVKWARKIEHNRYRVGLKFFSYVDKDKVVWKLIKSLLQPSRPGAKS